MLRNLFSFSTYICKEANKIAWHLTWIFSYLTTEFLTYYSMTLRTKIFSLETIVHIIYKSEIKSDSQVNYGIFFL